MRYLEEKGFDFKFLKSLMINFIGVLGSNYLIRKVSGDNVYMYLSLAFLVVIILFFYNIMNFGNYMKSEWIKYKKRFWVNLLISIFLFIILVTVLAFTKNIFDPLRPDPATTGVVQYKMPSANFLGFFVMILGALTDLFIVIVEEAAYRYEAMYKFRKSGKLFLLIMIIISSMLFGFSHFYNFNGSFIATIPYGILGIILAISYLITNNFWVPTVAHLLFNLPSLISTIFLIIVKLIS